MSNTPHFHITEEGGRPLLTVTVPLTVEGLREGKLFKMLYSTRGYKQIPLFIEGKQLYLNVGVGVEK